MLFAQPEAQLIMPTVVEDIDLSLRRAAAVEGSALSSEQRREQVRELLREAASNVWRTRAFPPSQEAKSSWLLSPVCWRHARRFFCLTSRLTLLVAQSRSAAEAFGVAESDAGAQHTTWIWRRPAIKP